MKTAAAAARAANANPKSTSTSAASKLNPKQSQAVRKAKQLKAVGYAKRRQEDLAYFQKAIKSGELRIEYYYPGEENERAPSPAPNSA